MTEYLLYFLVLVLIYGTSAKCLDLLVGHLGLLAASQGLWMGIGAYTAALVSINLDATPLLSMAIAGLTSCVFSAVLHVAFGTARGQLATIFTFAVQIVGVALLSNMQSLTNGTRGIHGIALLESGASSLRSLVVLSCLAVAVYGLCHVSLSLVILSPFGRLLHATRAGHDLPASLGKDSVRATVLAASISAAFAGIAGALYAYCVTFISPVAFDVNTSIMVLAMVLIGGAGSKWGPLAGAALLLLLLELVRILGIPSSSVGNIRQIVYGVVITVVILFGPFTTQGVAER